MLKKLNLFFKFKMVISQSLFFESSTRYGTKPIIIFYLNSRAMQKMKKIHDLTKLLSFASGLSCTFFFFHRTHGSKVTGVGGSVVPWAIFANFHFFPPNFHFFPLAFFEPVMLIKLKFDSWQCWLDTDNAFAALKCPPDRA